MAKRHLAQLTRPKSGIIRADAIVHLRTAGPWSALGARTALSIWNTVEETVGNKPVQRRGIASTGNVVAECMPE